MRVFVIFFRGKRDDFSTAETRRRTSLQGPPRNGPWMFSWIGSRPLFAKRPVYHWVRRWVWSGDSSGLARIFIRSRCTDETTGICCFQRAMLYSKRCLPHNQNVRIQSADTNMPINQPVAGTAADAPRENIYIYTRKGYDDGPGQRDAHTGRIPLGAIN